MTYFDDMFDKDKLKAEIIETLGTFDPLLWDLDADMGERFNDHIAAGKDPADFYINEPGFIYQSAWNCAMNDEKTKYSTMCSVALENEKHKAIDYGCAIGTGVCALALSDLHATGADICKPSLEFLKNRSKRFGLDDLVRVVDIGEEDYWLGKYDFIICTEVLEHVSDPIGLMKELIDIAVPGAIFILSWSFVNMTAHLPQHFHMQAKHPDTLLTEGFGKIVKEDLGLEFMRYVWFNNMAWRKS